VVELTHRVIETDPILQSVRSEKSGAVVLFLGTTREFTDAKQTATLIYTAYEPMAQQEMKRLVSQAKSRWPITDCTIVHRLGEVGLGEVSVAIAVACPHRREAFEAASWMIDRLKVMVPVWKKEHWKSGDAAWVHPGIDPRPGQNGLQ